MVLRGQKFKVKELDRLDFFLELQSRILPFSWLLEPLSGLQSPLWLHTVSSISYCANPLLFPCIRSHPVKGDTLILIRPLKGPPLAETPEGDPLIGDKQC